MKGKVLLSSLVTLSLVVSSYGVTFADTQNWGDVSTPDGVFGWSYNNDGILGIQKSISSYPNPARDWSTFSSDVHTMNIYGASLSPKPTYSYSDFRTGMYKLKTINVYDNCKKLSINDYCPSIEKISINNNSENFIDIDLSGRKSAKLPEISLNNVTAKYIDIDCSEYAGPVVVNIPASFGNNSKIMYNFENSNLTTVNFASGTKTIPEDAFYNCSMLFKVVIPDGVTSIEYSAFRKCPKLESITIPASVKSIGMNAFKESGIKTIDFLGTRAQWYGLVKEYNSSEELIGETLHLNGVVVHCSDGDVLIHKNTDNDPARYDYYQNYYGWEKYNDKWYYRKASGLLAAGETVLINNNIYYFNKDGVMQTGWFHINGSLWSYADKSGVLKQKGWLQDGGNWYYFNFYFMLTGWRTIGGVKYYFDKTSGKMVTGWQEIDGKWYLFNSSGAMQTGWKQSGNTWYYLDPSDGSMVTGWKEIDGKWYFLKSNGAMAASEWCGGYWLNADGTWTYPYKATWRKTNNKWWFGDDSGWYAKNETLIIDGVSYKFDAKGYLV